MHFAIQRNNIVAGHSVLCNIDWSFVTFIQETWSPVQTFRCYRPVDGCFWKAFIASDVFRMSIFTHADTLAIVDILTIDINRLRNKLHIIICDFGKIFFIFLQTFLWVFAQKYRIRPPGNIPGPVVWIIWKRK